MADETYMQRIERDIVVAMKARDAATLSTLRMIKAALLEAKVKKARDAAMSAEEELDVLQRYAKKRRETIAELTRIGRLEGIASEQDEIEVTRKYLPAELEESDIAALVTAAVAQVGATSPKEMGKVMGAVKEMVKARPDGATADGAVVSRLVKAALGG